MVNYQVQDQVDLSSFWYIWIRCLLYFMFIVDVIRSFDVLWGAFQIQWMVYYNGYYDGGECSFQGFVDVESIIEVDDSVEVGYVRYQFDVGDINLARKGRFLKSSVYSDGELIRIIENIWTVCFIAELLDDMEFVVLWICQQSMRTILVERIFELEWVMIEECYEYDGYGNRMLMVKYGVMVIGGGFCVCDDFFVGFGQFCGLQCFGDEQYISTFFVMSGEVIVGWWLLNKVC